MCMYVNDINCRLMNYTHVQGTCIIPFVTDGSDARDSIELGATVVHAMCCDVANIAFYTSL
jgi:hypothetical protein